MTSKTIPVRAYDISARSWSEAGPSITHVKQFMTPDERRYARELARLFIISGRVQYELAKRKRRVENIIEGKVELDNLPIEPDDREAVRKLRMIRAWMDPDQWRMIVLMFDHLRVENDQIMGLDDLGGAVLADCDCHDDEDFIARRQKDLIQNNQSKRAVGIGAMRVLIMSVRRMMQTYAYSRTHTHNSAPARQPKKGDTSKVKPTMVNREAARAMMAPLYLNTAA